MALNLFLAITESSLTQDLVVVLGAIGIPAAALQVWVRFRHEQVRHRRALLDLEHQERLFDAEIKERFGGSTSTPMTGRAPIAVGHPPRQRMLAASQSGTVFEPLEDAVANLQLRVASLDVGIDQESVQLARYLPVSVYIDSDDPGEFYALRDAVVRLLDAFDFEVVSETALTYGSIFQRLTAKLKSPATSTSSWSDP